MRTYEYNGIKESLKTLPTEITLKDFSKIIELQDKHKGTFMYYLEAFEVLGLSTEFTDVITDKVLYQLIGDFQEDFVVDNRSMVKTIELDGYTYTAYEDTFKLNARDLAAIEEKMNAKPFDWITYAMALIFKRDDLSATEHKAEAHRKYKEKLFEGVTMDIALPYVMYVAEGYMNNLKLLTKS